MLLNVSWNHSKTIIQKNIRFLQKGGFLEVRTMKLHSTVLFATGLVTKRSCAWTSGPVAASVTNQNLSPIPNTYHALTAARWMSTNEDSLEDGSEDNQPTIIFRIGDTIQVEVISFGPLGASVDIVGVGHDAESLIGEDELPFGSGLVLQREIRYFREGRNGVDVVTGEILPAYVEKVREDGRVHVSLRPAGGKAKAIDASKKILDQLARSHTIALGDKSTPEEIAVLFPGVSKAAFKKAVSALYKKGLVKPESHSITFMTSGERRYK
jgi:CvfB-like winged helix domain